MAGFAPSLMPLTGTTPSVTAKHELTIDRRVAGAWEKRYICDGLKMLPDSTPIAHTFVLSYCFKSELHCERPSRRKQMSSDFDFCCDFVTAESRCSGSGGWGWLHPVSKISLRKSRFGNFHCKMLRFYVFPNVFFGILYRGPWA